MCTAVLKATYTFPYTPFHYEVVKTPSCFGKQTSCQWILYNLHKTFSLGGALYFRKLKNKHKNSKINIFLEKGWGFFVKR